MNYEKEIDHEYTDEIVCPFCGCEFSDSWEHGEGEEDIGLLECVDCDKSFYASRQMSISYSTEKANYGICKHCKTENVVIEDYNSSIGSYNNLCIRCGDLEKDRLRKEYIKSIHNR